MRHRNIIRLAVITILTLLAATSSVLLVVSYWETMRLHNFADLDDLATPGGCMARLKQGILMLLCERAAPHGPWTLWRLGFWNFGIGHGVTAVLTESTKVQRRFHYLKVPLIVLVLAFAAYPFIAFVRGPLRRYRRAKAGCCRKCGYSLVGNVSGVCPECGTSISAEAKKP